MKLLLKVESHNIEEAREYGAKYDDNLKCWYIDTLTGSFYPPEWVPVNNVNIFCENLYLFEIFRECWKCRNRTPCVCLATDKSYSAQERFALNSNLQLFSLLKDIPGRLRKNLQGISRYYEDYSKQTNDNYIMNHCLHCGASQGDYYLHDLPETSFYQCLCYKDGSAPTYRKIMNNYLVPLSAYLPDYDAVSHSAEALLLHMQTEVENWASLNIDQKLVNELMASSRRKTDIIL